jgi:hypothetical protein
MDGHPPEIMDGHPPYPLLACHDDGNLSVNFINRYLGAISCPSPGRPSSLSKSLPIATVSLAVSGSAAILGVAAERQDSPYVSEAGAPVH